MSTSSSNTAFTAGTSTTSTTTSSTSNKRIISTEEWENRLKQIKINKNDLNSLVMNYLVVEGYKDAAEIFSQESNTPTNIHNLDSISDRVQIRSLILQQGKISEAIERVNDLNPEILDNNQNLYFKLQQQQLIELIRLGDLDAALSFAMNELAARGEENQEFLSEIEKTMSLLAFENLKDCPVHCLMEQSQRQKTASELNSAILESQCQEKTPKLPNVLKLLLWAQKRLDERVIYPKMINVQTGELSSVGGNSSSSSTSGSSGTTASSGSSSGRSGETTTTRFHF